MKRITILPGLLLLLLIPGMLGGQETRVLPGDSLIVSVAGHPELSGRFQVNTLGDLLIPNGGVLPVAGLVPPVIAQRIVERYRPYYGALRVSVTRPQVPEPEAPPEVPPPANDPVADTVQADSSVMTEPDSLLRRDTIPLEIVEIPRDSLVQTDTTAIDTVDTVTAIPEVEEVPSVDTVTVQETVAQPDTAVIKDPPVVTRPEPETDVTRPEATETWEDLDETTHRPLSKLEYGLTALGGVASSGSPSHPFGGVLGTAAWNKIGLMGLGQYGTGAGYSSLLFTGGITYEAYREGRVSVLGTGGYSYYSEEGDSGIKRSMPAVMVGGIARMRIGPVVPSVAITGFFGNYDGDELDESFSAQFVRVSFGIGFGR